MALNVALLGVLLEVSGNIFFLVQTGQFFYARERPSLMSAPETTPFGSGDFRIVLHPYFGYTFKPNVDERQIPYVRANNHGFLFGPAYVSQHPGCCDYPTVRAGRDELIVGIFGGSVAAGLAVRMQNNPALLDALAAAPRFAGKKVRLLQFAFGGHKQPQQLMILTYYLALGQPLDVVVNVDGFNEITTAPGNMDSGTEPNFPGQYMWRRLVDYLERQANQAHNPEGLLANYHLIMSQRWARYTADCRTATCYSLTRLGQYWHQSGTSSAATSAAQTAGTAAPFFFQVDPAGTTTLGRYEFAAERWAAASEVMQQLSRSVNILYLHVLQPNQWFRRLTPYVPRQPDDVTAYFNRTVPLGYAAFVAKGGELRRRGVNFLDGTAILDREPSSIYSDDVGHFMPQGYDMLARAIIRALAAGSSREPAEGMPRAGVSSLAAPTR